MKRKIKLSILFSSIALIGCTSVILPLTSCKHNQQNPVKEYNARINVLEHQDLLKKNITINDWIDDFNNVSSDNVKQLLDIIQTKINIDFDQNANLTIQTKNVIYKSNFLGNLYFVIYINNIHINVEMTNVYVYSNGFFIPPEDEVTSKEQQFEQVNLSIIAEIPYEKISPELWTSAINSTKNGQGFVIPPVYTLTKTTLSQDKKSYELIYKPSDLYKDQIANLSNADKFKEIKIKIILSPYIGKDLKTEFELNQEQINKFFGNNGGSTVTIDQVKNMTEKQIYEKLQKFVESDDKIQPLRDCTDPKDPSKIIDFSNNSNIAGNMNQLTIQFKSSGVKTYAYKFLLNFS